MFCNALMFAPDRIARLAAVCRSSRNLKSVGNPESDRALAHRRRRTLPPRIQRRPNPGTPGHRPPPAQAFWPRSRAMRRCDPYRSWACRRPGDRSRTSPTGSPGAAIRRNRHHANEVQPLRRTVDPWCPERRPAPCAPRPRAPTTHLSVPGGVTGPRPLIQRGGRFNTGDVDRATKASGSDGHKGALWLHNIKTCSECRLGGEPSKAWTLQRYGRCSLSSSSLPSVLLPLTGPSSATGSGTSTLRR